jgi:hypothetical protein
MIVSLIISIFFLIHQVRFTFTLTLKRLPTNERAQRLNLGLQVLSFEDLIAVAEITESSSFFTTDDGHDEDLSSSGIIL